MEYIKRIYRVQKNQNPVMDLKFQEQKILD